MKTTPFEILRIQHGRTTKTPKSTFVPRTNFLYQSQTRLSHSLYRQFGLPVFFFDKNSGTATSWKKIKNTTIQIPSPESLLPGETCQYFQSKIVNVCECHDIQQPVTKTKHIFFKNQHQVEPGRVQILSL